MRSALMLQALLFVAFGHNPVFSMEMPTEVFLSTDDNANGVRDAVALGKPSVFLFRSTEARDITLTLDAENGDCGFELQRSTELGYQYNPSRFPVVRLQHAQAGETFTLQFHQSRTAWVENRPCTFSFDIR